MCYLINRFHLKIPGKPGPIQATPPTLTPYLLVGTPGPIQATPPTLTPYLLVDTAEGTTVYLAE